MEHVEAHRFFNIRHDLSRALTRKMQKNVERFPVSGLTFSRHGDKLSADSGSVASGEWFPSSFSTVISAKVHVNRPSFTSALLLLR